MSSRHHVVSLARVVLFNFWYSPPPSTNFTLGLYIFVKHPLFERHPDSSLAAARICIIVVVLNV